MAAIENARVTVVGAGAVGSATAYAMQIRGSAREIVLYDIDEPRVRAEALDLAHGAMFAGPTSVTGTRDIAETAGSHVIVVTAGAAQKPGQTRLELIDVNARIMREMLPELIRHSPDAVIVMVTNPCDVLTALAVEQTGIDPVRLFASGCVLDSSRLRWALARRACVSVGSVHAEVVGEHGDTGFPVWSTASIGHVPVREWRGPDGGALGADALAGIADEVRTAAYAIIEGKGATYYAIGLSSARIAEAVLRDERAILPVAPMLDGVRGVSGVALSVPCVVGAAGAVPLPTFSLDDEEQRRLEASARTLAETAASVHG